MIISSCRLEPRKDSTTGVLFATNTRAQHIDNPEHVYNDEPKLDDDTEHKGDADTSKTEMKPQECANIKEPCTAPGVAVSKDFAVHPFAKMNTLPCSIKSRHRVIHVAHSMPHGTRKPQLVTQQFGVHPYAVVDLQKVRNLASYNFHFHNLSCHSTYNYVMEKYVMFSFFVLNTITSRWNNMC